MRGYGYPVMLVKVDKRTVSDRDHTGTGVTVYCSKGTYLVHVDIVETGKLAKHTLGSIVDTFGRSYKSAHQRPPAHLRLKPAAREQYAQAPLVETKDDTVNTDYESVTIAVIGGH